MNTPQYTTHHRDGTLKVEIPLKPTTPTGTSPHIWIRALIAYFPEFDKGWRFAEQYCNFQGGDDSGFRVSFAIEKESLTDELINKVHTQALAMANEAMASLQRFCSVTNLLRAAEPGVFHFATKEYVDKRFSDACLNDLKSQVVTLAMRVSRLEADLSDHLCHHQTVIRPLLADLQKEVSK